MCLFLEKSSKDLQGSDYDLIPGHLTNGPLWSETEEAEVSLRPLEILKFRLKSSPFKLLSRHSISVHEDLSFETSMIIKT